MIYLIDDKKLRQRDFGWNEEKFGQYTEHLTPLYDLNDIAKVGEDLFKNGNIIIYHESFLDFTRDKEKAVKQRIRIKERADALYGLSVAFFSGSESSRSLHKNVAHLPVANLYQNLEIFIRYCREENGNLNYLLFGENPEIEGKLSQMLIQANRNIEEDAIELLGKTIFIHTDEDFVSNAIIGAEEDEISPADDIHDFVIKTLSKIEYDNIFIPLCFGQTLSDYNGLRLATHIRCNASPNQLIRIFIYSFVGIDYLLDNEYFNILKTKNVELVPYSKKAFEKAVNTDFTAFKVEELPLEIAKLKLDPPLNYADSHSIANEWAIHQWAKTIGCDETPELVKVFENVETNLYFQYLKSTNPISTSDKISQDELIIRFKGKPKVLLIDDEVEKGWGEIFAHIFHGLNSIDFEEIGDGFKNESQEAIIKQSLHKIIENDIDLVILDFRLNSNDSERFNGIDVTSIRLLKKIKDYNPGIQVIVFSATNKVWNLQALQEVGADGFIHKDGSENIHQSIQRFVIQLTSGLEKAFWLKPFYKSFDKMKTNAKNLSDYFKVSLENNLSICFELLIKSFERKEYIKYAYLQLFHIVEEFIKEDSVFESGNNCYVVTPSLRYLVLSKKDPTKEDSPYYSALDFRRENRQYKVGKSKHTRRIDTYFIMSSILLFRNGLPTSGSENWQIINSIRNNKAAHPKGGIVKLKEVNMLSEFLKFILDESKIKPIESNHALKEQGTRRQIENLKKKWGVR